MNEAHAEIKTEAGTIRGMIHYPESSEPLGTVVIFHGYFSSNRVGPARLYVEVARVLADSGFDVVRFDCLGVGDSDGSFADVTLESELRDLSWICQFALKTTNVSEISIVGHSMGANLAVVVATKFLRVKGLFLLSPEVEKLGGIDRLFNPVQTGELELRGWTMRKGILVNASFIKSLRNREIIAISRSLRIPLYVFQGDRDELYSMDGAKLLVGDSPNRRFVVVEGADHNFLEPISRIALLSKLKGSVLELYCRS